MVRIVKAGALDVTEKIALLAVAGEIPSLWDGLEEEDVLAVLRHKLIMTGMPLTILMLRMSGDNCGWRCCS